MQFERGAPALVVLSRDQPAIEPQVFRAHRLERKSERIEVIGDGGQLAGMRLRQAHVIGLVLEVGEAGGEHGERIEHTAEQKIKQADHGDIERDGYDPHRDRVVPDLGDLVGGLADDFDLTDAAAADDHRYVERLDRRVDQSCEPSRSRRALVRASTVGPCRQRCGGNSGTRRILHRDPHMAHRPQLRRQGRQELLGRKLLLHEIDGVADQEFRQSHRGGHFDARLRAGPQDRDTAGDEHGDKIDQRKHQQELDADRAPAPERGQDLPARGWRQRQRCERGCGLRADRLPPSPFLPRLPRC